MYTKWKFVHYPYDGDWDNGSTEIAEYTDPLLSIKLGEGRDNFSFKVRNTFGDYNNYFNANDKIDISRVINTDVVGTDDIIMVGTVKDAPAEQNVSKDMIRVEGFNYSEVVMDAIVFIDATNMDVPTAIEAALVSAAKNTKFEVTWASSNPSTKTDGTAFPTVGKKYFYKPLRAIIEELSTATKTDDSTYYWYINSANELVWFHKDSTSEYTFDTSTDSYLALKNGKDIKDVKNFIIARGGRGPANNVIMIKEADYPSISKHGYKYYFLVDENADAGVLIADDMVKSWGKDESKNKRYPDLTSSFTTTWEYTGTTQTVDGVTLTNGSTVTVTTERQYNRAIIEEIRARLKKLSKEYLRIHKYGRLKNDITFKAGNKVWGIGDKIKATIPSSFSGEKTMRIYEIQYSTTTDTYSLEEDVGTL